MSGDWGNLSVVTIAGGQSLILKHNCEILVPKKERVNILNIAHKTHLGHESMVTQLRGRVFLHKMNADIHKVAIVCDPCQRYHISNSKEKLQDIDNFSQPSKEHSDYTFNVYLLVNRFRPSWSHHQDNTSLNLLRSEFKQLKAWSFRQLSQIFIVIMLES